MKKLLLLLAITSGLGFAANIKGDVNLEGGLVSFFPGQGVANMGNVGVSGNVKIEIPKTFIRSSKFKVYTGGGISQEVQIAKNLVMGRTKINATAELEFIYTQDIKPYVEANAGIGGIYNKGGFAITGGAAIGGGVKYKNIRAGLTLGVDSFGKQSGNTIYIDGTNVPSIKVGAKIGYEFDILKTNK